GSLKGGRWAALRVDCFAQQFLCALGCLIAAGTFGRCFGVFGMFRQSQLTFWVRNGVMAEVVSASMKRVWAVNHARENSAEGSWDSLVVSHRAGVVSAAISAPPLSSVASIALSMT